MFLAAVDNVTRQCCVRIIEAASVGGASSLRDMREIASSVALSPDLFMMQSVPAVNAVLAALGRPAVGGLDARSLDAAGWHIDVLALVVASGYDAVAAAGCDVSCILVSFLLCSYTRVLKLTPPPTPSIFPLSVSAQTYTRRCMFTKSTIARLFKMARSLCTCLLGGILRPATRMICASVAPILGRVLGWSSRTAPPVVQPCATIPLTSVRSRQLQNLRKF